ncbi:MAG: DUF1043 family protein [Pseudomonadota bacterium]|nr:DUF1043 family protein [Pseudomonadota bacterium]
MDFGPEISLVALFLGLVIGGAIGYLIGRGGVNRQRQALDDSTRAQADLKRDVETHLRETAGLMDRLAADYQDIYAHLAAGARQFGVSEAPLARGRALPHQSAAAEPAPHGATPDQPPRRDEPV